MTGSAPLGKMLQAFDEVEGAGGIQFRRKFVKEQNTRVPEHLDTDTNSLPFSSGTPTLPEPSPTHASGNP